MKNEVNALSLKSELDGVAHGLECIRNLLKDRESSAPQIDQPAMECVCEALFAFQKHILRIGADWLYCSSNFETSLFYPEHEADQGKPLSFSQMLGEDANSAGDKG